MLAATGLASGIPFRQVAAVSPLWHEQIAQTARDLDDSGPLQLLVPEGAAANVTVATEAFQALSGVECLITQVAPDDINVELILKGNRGQGGVDVALAASYGLSDLAVAGAIEPLDDYAQRHEPSGFFDDHLYRKGDFHQGRLFGYQTDGDAYLMFYNKSMLESSVERAAYESFTGKPLQVANTWEDLDSMMAFFHRPEEKRYGGNLFRSSTYLVWEWWARFHAKGYFPVADDMTPNINNAAGVIALEELIAAGGHQSPGAHTDSIFESWKEFSGGEIFCTLGWGGTQKYLSKDPRMRDKLIHAPLPGPSINGHGSGLGYFNWGWNYTVSAHSEHKQLAYLLALFCVSPIISTRAVREADGYFDPFRRAHYRDDDIERAYGSSFLKAHENSMRNSIPDFYLGGQGRYLDALRQQIMAVSNGEYGAQQGLDNCARQWRQVTRRLGVNSQRTQWLQLKDTYPVELKNHLLER